MKKIVALCLALAMTLALAACGSGGAGSSVASSPDTLSLIHIWCCSAMPSATP